MSRGRVSRNSSTCSLAADRDYIATVRRKLTVAIRTGRDTADVVRNAPELFLEGDMRAPGGVLGEVGGKPIGVPSNIDGETEEAKREQFAVILDQQFERAFPTTSFAGKLARTAAQVPPNEWHCL